MKFWAGQDVKYDFKKWLKIAHSNKAPDMMMDDEYDGDEDDDVVNGKWCEAKEPEVIYIEIYLFWAGYIGFSQPAASMTVDDCR